LRNKEGADWPGDCRWKESMNWNGMR